jgi:hypothetical protein
MSCWRRTFHNFQADIKDAAYTGSIHSALHTLYGTTGGQLDWAVLQHQGGTGIVKIAARWVLATVMLPAIAVHLLLTLLVHVAGRHSDTASDSPPTAAAIQHVFLPRTHNATRNTPLMLTAPSLNPTYPAAPLQVELSTQHVHHVTNATLHLLATAGCT